MKQESANHGVAASELSHPLRLIIDADCLSGKEEKNKNSEYKIQNLNIDNQGTVFILRLRSR